MPMQEAHGLASQPVHDNTITANASQHHDCEPDVEAGTGKEQAGPQLGDESQDPLLGDKDKDALKEVDKPQVGTFSTLVHLMAADASLLFVAFCAGQLLVHLICADS